MDDITDEYYSVIGASIGLGRRLTWPDDFFTLYNGFSYQRYRVKDYPGLFLVDNGYFNNFSFTTTIGRNSQNQIIYPRRRFQPQPEPADHSSLFPLAARS